MSLIATNSSQRNFDAANSALITAIKDSWASQALVMLLSPRVNSVISDGLNSAGVISWKYG